MSHMLRWSVHVDTACEAWEFAGFLHDGRWEGGVLQGGERECPACLREPSSFLWGLLEFPGLGPWKTGLKFCCFSQNISNHLCLWVQSAGAGYRFILPFLDQIILHQNYCNKNCNFCVAQVFLIFTKNHPYHFSINNEVASECIFSSHSLA